ncbi:unnamed protein product [Ectocarpus sp. 6 AP-2014]
MVPRKPPVCLQQGPSPYQETGSDTSRVNGVGQSHELQGLGRWLTMSPMKQHR